MPDLQLSERAIESIVQKFKWSTRCGGLDLDDLRQSAAEAVEHAKARFDSDRGSQFDSLAWIMARQAVHKHANEHRHAVRVPCHAAHGRGHASGRAPVVARTVSVTASPDSDADSLLDALLPQSTPDIEGYVDAERTAARVRGCIDTVAARHPRRGRLLRRLYLDGVSQTALGAELGVTRQAVQNMLVNALRDFEQAWRAAGWDAP